MMMSLSLLMATRATSVAQVESFLLLSHDTRTHSMGSAGVAASDAPGTILGNPAALGLINDPTIIVSASRPQFDDLYASASVALPLGEGKGTLAGYIDYGVGAQFQQVFENGVIGPMLREGPYIAAGVGWGVELQSLGSVGARGRIIHTSFPFFATQDPYKEPSTSFAFDLGAQVQLDPIAHLFGLPNKRLTLGASVANIGPAFQTPYLAFSLPTVATIGLSIHPYTDSTLRLSGAFDTRFFLSEGFAKTPTTWGVGAEVELFRLLALRFGATTFEWRNRVDTDIKPTVGLGVRLGSFDLLVAYNGKQIYSTTNRFDASVSFHL
jgi:hypothetical protein